MVASNQLQQVTDTLWELPASFKEGMRVPARIYGTEKLIRAMDEAVYDQISNVACLPGITQYAFCMPDGHFGYGFPIGGVAAMDIDSGGVISPGGIGFDINCGMRLVKTNLSYEEVQPYLQTLVDRLFKEVPAGVGSSGLLTVSRPEFRQICREGARWCIKQGLGWEEDLALTEEGGAIAGADPSKISERAIDRGLNQLGTLGSGNHYLEIQVIRPENIFDKELARLFGLDLPQQVVIMFHCGSRGFGHQVATDYLQRFLKAMPSKYHLEVPDRELACAPFHSPEGQDYFAAMKCALNISFANRQVILHQVRKVFSGIFGQTAEALDMHMIYDVAHNTAKLERHSINGEQRTLLVHRKGATRAFGPGNTELPEIYRAVGQPVIIGGSMETGSYLLVGTPEGSQAFFSTAHGSGRTMSRRRARKQWRGKELLSELETRGIYIRSASKGAVAEEAGGAYKDIDEVVDATARAGLSKPVIRAIPIGNIKG